MKKNYLLGISLFALFLLFNSCSQEEEQIIQESTKTTIEPDFFEADGSIDETEVEEEAPQNNSNTKTYNYYNYTLLKPSDLNQKEVNQIKCGETKIMPLLVGSKKKKVGLIKISNDDKNLYVTVKTNENKYMKKLYLFIGDKNNIPLYSNGFPKLREFNYKAFPYYYGGEKRATYTIPLSSIDTSCFEVVAYAKVYDRESRCLYSSFAYDSNLNQKYYYSHYYGYYYGKWVRSFDFCVNKCDDTPDQVECIGAFAYNNAKPERAFCFLDDGFSNGGWTNGKIFGVHTLQLYAKVEGCDWSTGEYIGFVRINYNPDLSRGKIQFITVDTEYKLKETYLFIGAEKYPLTNDGIPTSDPNEFPFVHKNLQNEMLEYTVEIDNHFIDNIPNDGFYVSAYALVTK